MTPIINYCIMGVESRMDNIKKNAKKLDIKDSHIFLDDRPDGGCPFYTAEKAWLSAKMKGETHRCVLQDDIEICDDFADIVKKIAASHPDSAISLCTMTFPYKHRWCEELTTPYVKAKNGLAGPCMLVPTKYLKDCFKWIHEQEANPYDDDIWIAKYCEAHDIEMIDILPSLASHDGEHSLLGHHWWSPHYLWPEKNNVDWDSTDTIICPFDNR